MKDAPRSAWGTRFEVADTDEVVAKVRAAGGTADEPYDRTYGRLAEVRDPFGAEFSVGSHAPDLRRAPAAPTHRS